MTEKVITEAITPLVPTDSTLELASILETAGGVGGDGCEPLPVKPTYPISLVPIEPAEGYVLVKLVMRKFSTRYLLRSELPQDLGTTNMHIIVGSNDSKYPVGRGIIIDPTFDRMQVPVYSKDNKRSFQELALILKEVPNAEMDEFVKNNPQFTLVGYYLLPVRGIIAYIPFPDWMIVNEEE